MDTLGALLALVILIFALIGSVIYLVICLWRFRAFRVASQEPSDQLINRFRWSCRIAISSFALLLVWTLAGSFL